MAKTIVAYKSEGKNTPVLEVVDTDGAITLNLDNKQVLAEQQATEAAATAPTAYAAHASGATTVTSNAATDLDTTAAALATLVTEVTALTTKVNNILTKLKAHGLIA